MSGLIDRHDLMAALDRAAERKVTVVSAPAGSGKTSALRLWAQRQPRMAFVTLQAEQPFWYAVLRGLRATCQAEPPGATPTGEQVLAELGAIDGSFVLVLDDVHELESTSELTSLLTALPTDVRVVVATRSEAPLGLHKVRLAGELAEIRSSQLRFTLDETRELVAAAGLTLPDHVTELLHRRTEGWAAGLRLAVLSLTGHPDPERFVAEFSGSDRTVAEYLMAEMLERQAPDVQRMLLRTSLLEQVNGELADLLAGGSGAERILLELEEANAFVVSLNAERTWFRYHQLFTGLLRLELRRTESDKITGLHRLAAEWLAEHGHPAEAIRHRQAAGDWAEAARLLTQHALGLTLDGKAGTVRALLRAFPASEESLALVRALDDLGAMRLDQAANHLNIARATGDDPLLVTALDLMLARLNGHYDCVVENVDTLPVVGPDLRAQVLLNLGATEAWSQRSADAERHLLEGAELARDINRPYVEVACLAYLAFTSVGQSVEVARQRSEEAIALATKHGWETEPVVAPAYATLAWAQVVAGDPDRAERSLELVRPDGEPGIALLAHAIGALIASARGDRRTTVAALEAALDHAERDGVVLPFVSTGAWKLLETLPPWETKHAALIARILDTVHGVPATTPTEALSPSELRVLRYLPTNLTRPEIAGELLVSLNTVNTHIRHIYAKLGATDRRTAVQRGRDLRLLSGQ